MSLQVWLPLNGNLNNQGLSGMTFSYVNNNGKLSVNSSGKLGKCYERTASAYADLYRSNTKINLSGDISMCCWAYVSSTIGDTANGLVTNHSHVDNTGVGITVKQVSTSDYRISCNTGTGSGRTYCTYYGTTNIKNAWHHLALTYDKTSKVLKLWVDGKCEYTLSNYVNASKDDYIDLFNWSTTYYTSGDFRPVCKLNDVRIYDNCLSTKEIKEISKGLVLHYKLTGHGSDNLFVNSHFDSRYQVTVWDTSKNGNYCADNWGGYNGGVGNPSTVYHTHLELKDNEYAYNYTKDANNDWLGIAQTITGRVSAGSTYTFSCELYRVSGTNYVHGGFYTKANSSATSNSFVASFSSPSFPVDGKWHKYSATMTIPSDAYLSNGVSFYIYGHSGGNGTFLMRHPKLEAGSVATSWCVSSSDSIYSTLSANRSVEYDLSGNKYNGTKSGNISALDSSPRYNSCTYMRASDAKIRTTLTTSGFANSFTISWWSNISDMSGKMAWGFSDGNRLNVYPATYFCWNTGDGGSNPFKNNGTSVSCSPYNGAWHHYAVTGNGSVNILYIDGKEVGRSTTYKGITGSTIYISGWDSGTNYAWSGGSISDFRIYATALSASDIKELYNSPISITNKGSIMCGELMEIP